MVHAQETSTWEAETKRASRSLRLDYIEASHPCFPVHLINCLWGGSELIFKKIKGGNTKQWAGFKCIKIW